MRNSFIGALCLGTWLCAQAASVQFAVVDAEGKPVQDAVVTLTPANPGKPTRSLPKQLSIANEKMQFVPSVSILATGGVLKFSNLDPYDHHIRGSAAGAKAFAAAGSGEAGGFELRMDGRVGANPPKVYDVPEPKPGVVLLGCHMHSSMRGHVIVSDSPWTAKTDAQGRVQFDDAPDGAFKATVWHAEQWVELPAQDHAARATHTSAQPLKVDFKLQVVPRKRRG